MAININNGLPGNNSAMFSSIGYNGVVGNQPSSALVLKNSQGDDVITFHTDGIIETKAGKIKANEWIQVTLIMKQFIMDVAQDEETSNKYPYIKEMAHMWLIDELKK